MLVATGARRLGEGAVDEREDAFAPAHGIGRVLDGWPHLLEGLEGRERCGERGGPLGLGGESGRGVPHKARASLKPRAMMPWRCKAGIRGVVFFFRSVALCSVIIDYLCDTICAPNILWHVVDQFRSCILLLELASISTTKYPIYPR